ncbi:hypothetical protein RclHR1_01550023 [Rhizophagus clarus]|uniref:Uncharacterized protein n=1 Tax=Rhizophagus clarus TaxID=94130 RepID=A0A2Z6QSQ5_9GLOM|nr:hypothetical protein RclHR1_01550023 [Rhizophagus clarus]GET01150.1 hypothetical protein RCL_jg18880.t1 [Rhizophagus clarus]
MKKGFLLTKPAKQVKKIDSPLLVIINYNSKSSPFNHFHDIITDFLSDLVTKNSSFFNSIIFSDPGGVENFLDKHNGQQVLGNKLIEKVNTNDCYLQTARFLACIINTLLLDDKFMRILSMDFKICQELKNYYNAMYPDIENLGNPIYQSDMSINVDEIDENLKGLLDNELNVTFSRNNTLLPVMFLTKFQKKSAKKKACKEKKKVL